MENFLSLNYRLPICWFKFNFNKQLNIGNLKNILYLYTPKNEEGLRLDFHLLTKYFIIMYLTAEKKQEIFGKYGKSNTDTGSPEAQIALFSYRINHLTQHLKLNKKDYSTERALVMLVGKRRRLLDYLIKNDIMRYRAIIKELGIRK